MNKKKYIKPQSAIVFCERHLLDETYSQWTNEAFGKGVTMSEEDDDWDNNSDFGYDRFGYDSFGPDEKNEKE